MLDALVETNAEVIAKDFQLGLIAALDEEAASTDYLYGLVQVPTLTGAFARSFFRGDWFTERLHSSNAALDRHWSIVTLLPLPDAGSAQDRALQALADARQRFASSSTCSTVARTRTGAGTTARPSSTFTTTPWWPSTPSYPIGSC